MPLLRLCGSPQDHIESSHRLCLKRRQGVRVPIERDVNVLVPEHLAHDLRIGASRELEGRKRVPQVMEPDPRQFGSP